MKKLLMCGSLLGLLVASVAWGQTAGTNAISRNGYCFNATTGQMVDCVTGAVLNNDVARDRNYTVTYNNIISSALTNQSGKDSSAVIYTGDCKRWWLQIRVLGLGAGAAVPYCKLGIRVRSHLSGVADSLNTITWDPTPYNFAAGTTVTDSLTYGSVAQQALISQVGPSEIEAIVTAEGGASLAAGTIPNNYSKNMLIPLKDTAGNWYEADWTSVWVRNMAGSVNAAHTVTISLVGKP